MDSKKLTPISSANRLVRIVEHYCEIHSIDRFPVDVDKLACGVAETFGWRDPITEINALDLGRKIDGALVSNDDKSKWFLLYNKAINSPGRIRFTKAHELAHYILHRKEKCMFECTEDDMRNWTDDENDIEGQADQFASHLLMPIDDFRKQISDEVSFDNLSHCAERYGVSLTAAILKWLSFTDEKVVMVVSIDGFMDWAWSSKGAFKSGAFFRTRRDTIPVPEDSIAADPQIVHEKNGVLLPARSWFRFADPKAKLRELKLTSEKYGTTITLLKLPQSLSAWPEKMGD